MPVEFNWSEPGVTEFLVICFNLGNFLAVTAFLVRGAITLRMLTVVGALLQALFYAFVAQDIITYGLFWKSLTAVIAFAVVLVIVRERMGRQFASELRPLAKELQLLNPGQIEKLFRVGEVRVAEAERCILSRGTQPDELFYLLEGKATVIKDGRPIDVLPGAFLGEIAFVSDGVATADVLIAPGSTYLAWRIGPLKALLAREDQIDIALRGLINHDLARKVSAQPVAAARAPDVVAG
jgi:CRP-like cAMP-binding protein